MSKVNDSGVPEQLDEFGHSMHKLLLELPEHPAITDTCDYILGALYGLAQAHRIGFKDRSRGFVSVYRPHLANYALEVAGDGSIDSLWLGGFFFNSAIQRLASAFDRIPRMLGAKMTKRVGQAKRETGTSAKERMKEVNATPFLHWEKVYDEVNAFKHSPEGKAAGREVTMSDALAAFAEMLQLLRHETTALAKRYKP
jgi:hypothetical protein